MPRLHAAEPASLAPIGTPDIEVIAQTHHPDDRFPGKCAIASKSGNLQFFCCSDLVEFVACPCSRKLLPTYSNSFSISYSPVILSRSSGYRAPCTSIFNAALSISRRSSGVSSIWAASIFSSKRDSLVVPGMGTIHGF